MTDSSRGGPRHRQPMARPALAFVALALTGVLSPVAVLIGAVLIVALDLALPWRETE